MNTGSAADPALLMMTELAELGIRAARVVVRVMEIEQAAAEMAASWLPEAARTPGSLSEAAAAGQVADAVDAALGHAVPRLEVLARALDRVSRSVRRSLALQRRMEAGWPRVGSPDDRQAMVRRQVARKVGEAITRECDGEAAERLFDELAERLDDPELDDAGLDEQPVEELVRLVCSDLGLAAAALEGTFSAPRRLPGEPEWPDGARDTALRAEGAGVRAGDAGPNPAGGGAVDTC